MRKLYARGEVRVRNAIGENFLFVDNRVRGRKIKRVKGNTRHRHQPPKTQRGIVEP